MKDYYKILGISREASQEDIKRAFYKLAHKHHPDKGGDERKFKELNEAYQILSDKEKRGQYDNFGRVFDGTQGPQTGGPGGAWDFNWSWGENQGFPGGFGQEGEGFDFDLNNLGDLFEGFFNRGVPGTSRTKKKSVRKGKDIRVDIEIPLEAVLKGISQKIKIRKLVVCSRCSSSGAESGSHIKECFSCRGTGEVQQIRKTFLGSFTTWAVCPECGGEGNKPEKVCNVCKGEGRIKSDEEIEVLIPAGVDSNQIIKILGKGEAGRKGGKAGDLYIRILTREHPVFKRKGDNLYVSALISLTQAALGDEIEIKTLEGTKILLKVPEGFESGKVLKISGKGIPHFSSFGRGDMYVELVIKTPKKLTKEQKELLEKLKKEGI